MTDSTNPRVMADNIRELSGVSGSQASEISKLQITLEALQTYDDAETETGKKWIDGSPIYRKVFEIEALPSDTSTFQNVVTHGISNLAVVTDLNAFVISSGVYAPITYITPGNDTDSIGIQITDTYIRMKVGKDRSGNTGLVIMEYTKATEGQGLRTIETDENKRK